MSAIQALIDSLSSKKLACLTAAAFEGDLGLFDPATVAALVEGELLLAPPDGAGPAHVLPPRVMLALMKWWGFKS